MLRYISLARSFNVTLHFIGPAVCSLTMVPVNSRLYFFCQFPKMPLELNVKIAGKHEPSPTLHRSLHSLLTSVMF